MRSASSVGSTSKHAVRRATAPQESFAYRLVKGETNGVPWVVEAAFAYAPGASGRTLITGINWSPALTNPFRSLGGWTSLDTVLTEQWARPGEPVIVALHLACPRVEYLDRGKSGVALPHDVSAAITSAVTDVTKRWAKQRKAEERSAAASLRRDQVMERKRNISIKAAAWEVMEAAYLKASANGTLPANARQVYYAARPRAG